MSVSQGAEARRRIVFRRHGPLPVVRLVLHLLGWRLGPPPSTNGQPIMITEFGGIACSDDPIRTWGYSRAGGGEDLANRYRELLRAMRGIPILAGFCYTQFTDTYQETNGLLFADRTPKFPLDAIAMATCGPQTASDQQLDLQWRERLMREQRAKLPAEDHL